MSERIVSERNIVSTFLISVSVSGIISTFLFSKCTPDGGWTKHGGIVCNAETAGLQADHGWRCEPTYRWVQGEQK